MKLKLRTSAIAATLSALLMTHGASAEPETQAAAFKQNALTVNALTVNRLALNRLALNRLALNGFTVNSLDLKGEASIAAENGQLVIKR